MNPWDEHLPTWEHCAWAVKCGEASDIEKFIHAEEPQSLKEANKWREALWNAMEEYASREEA